MFACKDIFAKPSIPQERIARRAKPKDLRRKDFCGYYTIKGRKCL